jgi:hypothetical protein
MSLRVPTTLLAALLLSAAPTTSRADAPSAVEALPATTAFYLHIASPGDVLRTLQDHPLRSELADLPAAYAARQTKEFAGLQVALSYFELQMNQEWPELLDSLAAGGLHLAWDRQTQAPVLLARGSSSDALNHARETLFNMVRAHTHERGGPGLISERTHGDVAVHRLANAELAVVDEWLIASPHPRLMEQVIDRLLGDKAASLASHVGFQSSQASHEGHTVWSWMDLSAIRAGGKAEPLFRGRADDFGGALVAGGILMALADAPQATLAVDLNRDHVKLVAALPGAFDSARTQDDYFFGAGNTGTAPPRLSVARRLGSICVYRDLAALWHVSPDILDDGVNAQLAKAESDLSNLFGGRSFSSEILAAVGPEVQLVFARQAYSPAATPAIELPAAAAVFQLTSASESQRPLRIAFQTAMGFANIVAAQQGRPAWELSTHRNGDITVVSATAEPSDSSDAQYAHIPLNFSPAIAFVGDWMVLASTRELADDLAGALSSGSNDAARTTQSHDPARINTSVEIEMPQLHRLLTANHGSLVARNMLEKGHGRTAAEQEIATLERLVSLLERVNLDLKTLPAELQLALEFDFIDR